MFPRLPHQNQLEYLLKIQIPGPTLFQPTHTQSVEMGDRTICLFSKLPMLSSHLQKEILAEVYFEGVTHEPLTSYFLLTLMGSSEVSVDFKEPQFRASMEG